jgi:cytochrome bd-type quinol oxidase subunit 1
MDFPVWLVELLTAPMLIPAVAVPHVIVAMFVVGGGFLLADLVARARREGRAESLRLLRGQTRAFMLLSLVFGAVTGVGIWWTIGLTSPETTRDLIRIFVFGWAAEWVVFVVEIVSLLAFYYLWDRVTPREHVILGWIYAAAAWLSLVLITGITSFMLTSGAWRPGAGFFTAFLNPSFVPQVLIRTGGSLVLGALGLGLMLSLQRGEAGDRERQLRRMSLWGLLGVGILLAGAAGYALTLPDHARLNLIRAPILNAMTAAALASGVAVLAALAGGFVAGARWLNPPFALVMVLVAAAGVTAGEFMREAARKPYRIERQVLAPGFRVADVDAIRAHGLAAASPWLRAGLATGAAPGEDADRRRVRLGEAVFSHHCAACHAHVGYNGIVPIVQPWTPELLRDTVRHLHRTNPAMPPWVGNEEERDALVAYLSRFAQGRVAE